MNRWLNNSLAWKAGHEKLLKSSLLSIVIATMFFGTTALSEAPVETKENVGPARAIEMSRMIPMRDGVKLETWIFKPSHRKAQSPTVLELTRYAIDAGSHHDSDDLVRRGYSRGFPSTST